MPDKKLTVSASPHVRSAQTVSGIMLNVIIALIPALAASVFHFGEIKINELKKALKENNVIVRL